MSRTPSPAKSKDLLTQAQDFASSSAYAKATADKQRRAAFPWTHVFVEPGGQYLALGAARQQEPGAGHAEKLGRYFAVKTEAPIRTGLHKAQAAQRRGRQELGEQHRFFIEQAEASRELPRAHPLGSYAEQVLAGVQEG